MIAIERILCPTDLTTESDEALRYAVALSSAHNAKLFVSTVRKQKRLATHYTTHGWDGDLNSHSRARVSTSNAGTMTMRTANVKLRPADVLDISSEDAKRLKLHKGDRVLMRSRYGEATLRIRITSTVKPGQLFATFHTAEVFLNRVTSPHTDRYKSPEYKVTAVKIEKLKQER